jgi:hypothetical protein
VLLLAAPVAPGAAQTVQPMTVVTPFTQGKVTTGMSNVTYRVGGVFAEAAEPAQHLSLTFVCREGGNLSLVMVHKRVPRQAGAPGAKIGIQVDDRAPQRIEASRETGDGLSAYTVAGTADAVALAKTLGAGKRLRLELDDYAYDLPLEGLAAALTRLAAVCPYG